MIRRHPTQALFAVLVALAFALGWSYVARSSVPVPPTVEPQPGESLVVVGVGGISWDDVSAAETPVLWGLLRDGAAASISVKTLHLSTCPVDGWATLSAGESAGPDVAGPRPECGDLPKITGSAEQTYAVDGFARLAADSKAAAFHARLGLLGDSFARAGTCVTAVGPGAALAVATADGAVARYTPFSAKTLVTDLAQCPVSVVDAGAVVTSGSPADRAETIAAIEKRITEVRDAMPNGGDLMVVGLSDRDRQERLRVLAATGPHYPPGILGSASTRMSGIAQISDVTATILQRGGVDPIEPIGGRALWAEPSANNSEATAQAKLVRLTDIDTKADAMQRVVVPFLVIWLGGTLLVLGFLAIMWRRVRPWHHRFTRQRVLRLARAAASVAAAMPAATFLANLVPWWRASDSPLVLVPILLALVLVITVALALVSLNGPWSRSALGPLAALSFLTAAVIGIDLLTGSHLQISSIFGLQPLVGGRFYGMGNVAFAIYAPAVLLLCAAMAHALVRRDAPRQAVLAVLAIGGIALAIDVLPAWGADFGGPIALVPALGYLLLVAAGLRITLRNLILVGAAAGGVVLVVAVLDWMRPEAQRSHPGRFLQSLLDGDAGGIIARKFLANVELAIAMPVLLGLVALVVGLAIFVVLRPGSLGTAPLARLLDEAPLLRAGLQAVVIMAVIGFLTNDSGAAIPPVALLVAGPAVLAAVVHFMALERDQAPIRRRRDRHHI